MLHIKFSPTNYDSITFSAPIIRVIVKDWIPLDDYRPSPPTLLDRTTKLVIGIYMCNIIPKMICIFTAECHYADKLDSSSPFV